ARPVGEKASDEDAHGAAEEKRGERTRGEPERRAEELDHGRHGEGLDADERGRDEGEEGEGGEDGRREEEPDARAQSRRGGGPAVDRLHAIDESRALRGQRKGGRNPEGGHGEERSAPAQRRGEP